MNSILGQTAELGILLKLKDEAIGPLNNFDRALGHLDTHATTVSGGLSKIGSGMALGAARVALGAVAIGGAVAAIGISSVDAASKFQASMELIATQAGATQSEVDTMSQAVLGLAAKVGTSPDELAAGLYHIESAGYRGARALDVLKMSAEGAKIGGANLEDVTNALVGAVKTGIPGTEDLGKAMGLLNSIVGSGNMRMVDLTGAIATGILPTAKSMGLTLTDVGAALADMTDQGIPAVDAATRLRMTFSLMEAPTSKAQKALKEIGMSGTDMANDFRKPNGLLVALTDLKTHLDNSGLSAVQQSQIISAAFGGGRTSSTILTLLGSLGDVRTKYDSITAGANNFAAAWDNTALTIEERKSALGAGIDSLRIQLGNELLPVEGKVLDALTKLASDPAIAKGIQDLGSGFAGLFTDQNISNATSFVSGVVPGLMTFASNVLPPLEEGLKITGAAAKEAFDLFMSLPEPVKAAVIAALAVNKLSGGLVASGIGDLAKIAMGSAGGGGGVAGMLGVQKVFVVNMPPGGIGGIGGLGGLGSAAVETGAAAGGGTVAELIAAGGTVSLATVVPAALAAIGIIGTTAAFGALVRMIAGPAGPETTRYNPTTGQAYGYSPVPGMYGSAPIEGQTVATVSHDTSGSDAHIASVAALAATEALQQQTGSSHDTWGSDAHIAKIAAAAAAALTKYDNSKPVISAEASRWAGAGKDAAAANTKALTAATTLDAAVTKWRDTTLPDFSREIRNGFTTIPAPEVHVTVNTTVSARDVASVLIHAGFGRTTTPQ